MSENDYPKTVVALATYNERENLPELLQAIRTGYPEVDVLVVDDSSPDGTGDWAREQAEHDDRLFVIMRPGKSGLGSAIVEAMQFAINEKYDYFVNLDADFSHPVEAISRLLQAIETGTADRPIDVAIGSRYIQGGGIIGWSWHRRRMSWAINLFVRWHLRLPTRDNSGSFRCYRVKSLKTIDFGKIRSRGYSFFEEILFRLRRNGATFVEIPIIFTDRTRGSSKINTKEAINAVCLLWKIGWER